jgi:hypothetical protein
VERVLPAWRVRPPGTPSSPVSRLVRLRRGPGIPTKNDPSPRDADHDAIAEEALAGANDVAERLVRLVSKRHRRLPDDVAVIAGRVG